jgi:acyl carrier protein
MSVRLTVQSVMEDVAAEQEKKLAPLSDDTILAQSGLDSLCFAIIVARLEDALGVDPFTASDEVYFPVTFGDFVSLYENVATV